MLGLPDIHTLFTLRAVMRSYIRLLSPRQRTTAAVGLAVVVLLVAAGLVFERRGTPPAVTDLTPSMSLKEIAPRLGVTGKGLARELGLPLETPKDTPLTRLGVPPGHLDRAVAHILSHRATGLKYWFFGALVVWGWIYLTRLGRPDRAIEKRQRRFWYPRRIHLGALVVTVCVTGFLLGKSPNPMEGAVKVFKSMVGLYPDSLAKVLAFLFFLGLAVVGNKLICGWACPFGALQELVHSLPWLGKLKRRAKRPFAAMNAIRAGLFALTLLILFGWLGGQQGFVLYHFLNPFNVFDLEFEAFTIALTVVLALVVGLVVYRPFCQVICPFGFLSWLVERLSFYRVRIDPGLCTQCGACGVVCPSDAAIGLMREDALRADCFSCGRCLSVCPADAIHYESISADHTPAEGEAPPRQARIEAWPETANPRRVPSARRSRTMQGIGRPLHDRWAFTRRRSGGR